MAIEKSIIEKLFTQEQLNEDYSNKGYDIIKSSAERSNRPSSGLKAGRDYTVVGVNYSFWEFNEVVGASINLQCQCKKTGKVSLMVLPNIERTKYVPGFINPKPTNEKMVDEAWAKFDAAEDSFCKTHEVSEELANKVVAGGPTGTQEETTINEFLTAIGVAKEFKYLGSVRYNDRNYHAFDKA